MISIDMPPVRARRPWTRRRGARVDRAELESIGWSFTLFQRVTLDLRCGISPTCRSKPHPHRYRQLNPSQLNQEPPHMPLPTEERVSQLVAGLVERRGFDLEGVAISAAGTAHTRVVVTVDSDETASLDAVAELSSQISEALDEAGDFGDTPYLLEVTSPGIDRPLIELRHWRRARGRKVKVTLRPGVESPEEKGKSRFEARVGAATDTEVALVLGGKRKPHRVTVPLADIEFAVVQVEFSPPGAAELELAGGVAPGRPQPGAQEGPEVTEEATEADAAEVASDSSTEGIVE
ncbi:ribosome maturation factor RimP [Nocardia sp. NPDC051030]|uniref:ribosome maturation factor RimP n=1 Tax=Nocardia sp. NPDC051030 TaxID=3155162 RepID=UPI0034144CE3